MFRKIDPQAITPYLQDASNYAGGHAEEVVIPESPEELSDFLKTNHQPLTVSGAGTGVTASRIPHGGVIISLEKMNSISPIDAGSIVVGPAASLKDLQEALESEAYFYPPNPTETFASIGGTLATNASGSRSYKFGATRDYVLEADILLADGGRATLTRGQHVGDPMKLEDGRLLIFPDIKYTSPACKNAAGYHVRPGMDWLDLFVGSEGTLGIFTRIRLKLLPRPEDYISGILFFSDEESSWKLTEAIRSLQDSKIAPCSLEYFDQHSLERLKSKFPSIPENAKSALFFEQDIANKDDFEPTLECWFEFLESQRVDLDDSWFARDVADQRRFHEFRHAIPVLLNEENSRTGRVKVGTDMAVPDEFFMEMMRYYKEQLSHCGVEYVVFGHLGDNHLHINFLPGKDEKDRALKTYESLVTQILKWGGTVSAEHGIGKLKKQFFAKMAGPQTFAELQKIKDVLDPRGLLGQGNIF